MGYCNGLLRELLALFLKTVHQNNHQIAVEKTKQSKGIISRIYPYLPKVFGIRKFLEIPGWYRIQFLDQTKDPSYLLSLFSFKRVYEPLNRTISRFRSIKPYFSIHT